MAQGYVRQSAASIVSGEVVKAAPINAEFNQIQAAFSESTGHAHDGSTGGGSRIARISDATNSAYLSVSTTGSYVEAGFSSAANLRLTQVSTGQVALHPTTGSTLTIGTTANQVNAELGTVNVSTSITISGLFTLSTAATATLNGRVNVNGLMLVPTPTSASTATTVANKTYADAIGTQVSADAATAAAAAVTAQNWASTAQASAAAAAASAVDAMNWASTAAASAAAAAASAALVANKISRSTAVVTNGALLKFEGTTGDVAKPSTWVENSTSMVAGTNLNMSERDILDGSIATSSARSFKGKVGTSWQQTDKGNVGATGATINEYDAPWIKISLTSSGAPITVGAPSTGYGYSVLIKLVEATGGTFNPVFSKSTGTVISWTPTEPTWTSYTTATNFVLASLLVDPDYDVTLSKVKDNL